MSKRVAFITASYAETKFTSGGVKLNYILIRALIGKGYTVDVFAQKYKNCIHNDVNYYNFSEFEQKNEEHKYFKVLSDKACYPSDLTYIHDHSYNFRVERMYSKVEFFFYKLFRRKKHKKRLKYDKYVSQNLDKTGKVIVSSEVLKQDFIKNFGVLPENIFVLPPCLETVKDNYKKLEFDNKQVVFGLSAVGFERKGGYLLLDTIKYLKRYAKNFKVRIIYPSNNAWVKFLVKFYGVEQYVEFLPSQSDMSAFYNSINFLLLPSLLEPFGMVVNEAMLNYCPAVVASHCGASDLIDNEKNGFLFDFGKNPVKALADVMLKCMDVTSEEYSKLSINAYERVKVMSSEHFINTYLELMGNE